jgi:alpha-galactosidase
VRVGALPPQLTALMRTNVNVQELTVAATLQGKREHVYHAAMLDPHTAAELPLDAIEAMVTELLQAHADWLPEGLVSGSPPGA